MRDFDHFDPEALRFLDDLNANNTREWFAANKKTYETQIKHPAAAFAEALAISLGDLVGVGHTPKVFRIHRDVRFSKDKTPYNTHVHISFTPDVAQETPPMWFFGLDTKKLTLGCGVFGFEKAALNAFRDDMAGPRGVELIQLAKALGALGLRISEPALKTVPRGYDKDHPNAEALRRKGFSAWKDIQDRAFVTQPNLVRDCIKEFEQLLPVYRFLSG